MNDNRTQILEKIRELEESIKDTIENPQSTNSNYYDRIKDIKYIEPPAWTENRGGSFSSEQEDLFIVEIERHINTKDGKEQVKIIPNYYLGKECIGANINGNIVYKENYQNQINRNLEKAQMIDKILEGVASGKINTHSYNDLENDELAKVFSAYLGENVDPKTVEKALNEMTDKQKDKLEHSINKDADTSDLSKKQTEEIRKISGVQEIDLSRTVDGKQSLEKGLMGDECPCPYSKIMVVYSDKANDLTGEKSHVNNTRYTLIGIPKDSKEPAKILKDEFEIDPYSGNNSNEIKTKVREDETATRDNNDVTTFRNTTTNASIAFENENHSVNVFFYPTRTREENEPVGIQVETPQTRIISRENRNTLHPRKGNYGPDNVQDEVESRGSNVKGIEYYDGDMETPEIPNENDLIPDTKITWRHLARKLGYNGKGAIEQTIKVFNKEKEQNPESDNFEIATELEEDAINNYRSNKQM